MQQLPAKWYGGVGGFIRVTVHETFGILSKFFQVLLLCSLTDCDVSHFHIIPNHDRNGAEGLDPVILNPGICWLFENPKITECCTQRLSHQQANKQKAVLNICVIPEFNL